MSEGTTGLWKGPVLSESWVPAFIITTAGCGTRRAVNIVLAADPRCFLGGGVTLRSIIDHANRAAELDFYLFLTGNVKPGDRRRLQSAT